MKLSNCLNCIITPDKCEGSKLETIRIIPIASRINRFPIVRAGNLPLQHYTNSCLHIRLQLAAFILDCWPWNFSGGLRIYRESMQKREAKRKNHNLKRMWLEPLSVSSILGSCYERDRAQDYQRDKELSIGHKFWLSQRQGPVRNRTRVLVSKRRQGLS